MHFIRNLGYSAVLALAGGLSAAAQNLVSYDQVGVWDILVDPSVGNGCLIASDFEDGSSVRIGFDRQNQNGYIMAMNKAWGDIEDGATYNISFDVDGHGYDGQAKGIHLDGLPGVDISVDNSKFFDDLAARNTLTLYAGKTQVMSIDLADSAKALDAAVECQKHQR